MRTKLVFVLRKYSKMDLHFLVMILAVMSPFHQVLFCRCPGMVGIMMKLDQPLRPCTISQTTFIDQLPYDRQIILLVYQLRNFLSFVFQRRTQIVIKGEIRKVLNQCLYLGIDGRWIIQVFKQGFEHTGGCTGSRYKLRDRQIIGSTVISMLKMLEIHLTHLINAVSDTGRPNQMGIRKTLFEVSDLFFYIFLIQPFLLYLLQILRGKLFHKAIFLVL